MAEVYAPLCARICERVKWRCSMMMVKMACCKGAS